MRLQHSWAACAAHTAAAALGSVALLTSPKSPMGVMPYFFFKWKKNKASVVVCRAVAQCPAATAERSAPPDPDAAAALPCAPLQLQLAASVDQPGQDRGAHRDTLQDSHPWGSHSCSPHSLFPKHGDTGESGWGNPFFLVTHLGNATLPALLLK